MTNPSARELLAAELNPVDGKRILGGGEGFLSSNTALRAITRALSLPQWEPITSAPDEGEVLVWAVCETSGQGWVSIARRWRGGWLSIDDGTVAPTHWMPKPAPPVQPVEEKENGL